MLERLFDDYYIRQRLLESPMGPYLEVLVSKLLEAGYCHSQAQKIVNTAVALGRWLEARGLTPVEAGKDELWTHGHASASAIRALGRRSGWVYPTSWPAPIAGPADEEADLTG